MLCDILTFVICDEIDQFKVSCQRFSHLKVTMLDLGTVIVCTVVAHGNAEEKNGLMLVDRMLQVDTF